MSMDDDTTGQPLIWRCPLSDDRRTDKAPPPMDQTLDDRDISLCRRPADDLAEGLAGALTASIGRRSGRRQPRRGSVSKNPGRSANPGSPRMRWHLEVGHFQVTDLGILRQIVQGQRPADPATLAVHRDLQQPSGDCLWCLFAETVPGDPRTNKVLLQAGDLFCRDAVCALIRILDKLLDEQPGPKITAMPISPDQPIQWTHCEPLMLRTAPRLC